MKKPKVKLFGVGISMHPIHCKNTDINGMVLEEYLDEERLVCINDGKGTRYNITQNSVSVLDLTITSREIAGIQHIR